MHVIAFNEGQNSEDDVFGRSAIYRRPQWSEIKAYNDYLTILYPKRNCTNIHMHYRCSVDKKGPETRHKLRGVKCTSIIGVRFVGKVARRSGLREMDIS